jgi:hypothetical protein
MEIWSSLKKKMGKLLYHCGQIGFEVTDAETEALFCSRRRYPFGVCFLDGSRQCMNACLNTLIKESNEKMQR